MNKLVGLLSGIVFGMVAVIVLKDIRIHQTERALIEESTYIKPVCAQETITRTLILTNTRIITEPIEIPFPVTNTITVTHKVTVETWIKLSGDWVVTHYGTDDGTLGQRTGSAWNGYQCPDWHSWLDTTDYMPGVVDKTHFGIAMPGKEFYCLPVKVCIKGQCIVGTAVDVPRDDVIYGKSHIDVWPVFATSYNIVEAGIVTDGVEIYIGDGMK